MLLCVGQGVVVLVLVGVGDGLYGEGLLEGGVFVVGYPSSYRIVAHGEGRIGLQDASRDGELCVVG